MSVALLGVVLAYVDLGEMRKALEDGDWRWFLAGAVFIACAVVIGALRWRVLLDGGQIRATRLRASKVFAASVVLNHVLPTSVGGDALRTWLVGRESGRLVSAATATIVDKLASLVCLVTLAWVALALDPDGVPGSVVGVFVWITVGLALVLVAAALAAMGVRPILHRLPGRVVVMIREIWTTFRVWVKSAKLMSSFVSLAVTYQVLVVLAYMLIGKTVGLELTFALMAVSLSVVLLAMMIPVSIGGLGVREGGFVLLLGQADIGAAQATVFSLLSVGAMVVASGAVFVVTAAVERLRSPGSESPAARPEPAATSDASHRIAP